MATVIIVAVLVYCLDLWPFGRGDVFARWRNTHDDWSRASERAALLPDVRMALAHSSNSRLYEDLGAPDREEASSDSGKFWSIWKYVKRDCRYDLKKSDKMIVFDVDLTKSSLLESVSPQPFFLIIDDGGRLEYVASDADIWAVFGSSSGA